MKVYVCIGSSCHLKGSFEIANELQKLINDYSIHKDEVELTATYCLGKCSASGVTLKIDDEIIFDATIDNIEQIFKDKVLSKFTYANLMKK